MRSDRASREPRPLAFRQLITHPAAAAMLAVSAMLLLAATACALPGGQPAAGESVATAVAATLQAAPSAVPKEPGSPVTPTFPTDSAVATDAPGAAAGSFSLAYADGGDVWLIEGEAAARQLSTTGGVTQVTISSDGQRIAFARREQVDQPSELWAVNRDGTGQTMLLASRRWNELYDSDGFLFNDLAGMEFLPGSHLLILGTQAVPEGPGVFRYDDLLRLDADTGDLSTLLPPGHGGAFTPSPDGETIAIVRPTSIGLVHADGSDLRADLVTFPMIITYSEYQSYPRVTWSPDSRALGAAIASADPLTPDPSGTVWRIEADSAAVSSGPAIPGDFFFSQFSAAALAPDLRQIAFGRRGTDPNTTELYLGQADGSGIAIYTSGDAGWKGWSPDGGHFVFSQDSPVTLRLGAPGALASPLGSGHALQWINPGEFVLLGGGEGSWTLSRGTLSGLLEPLASPSGEHISFDVIPR